MKHKYYEIVLAPDGVFRLCQPKCYCLDESKLNRWVTLDNYCKVIISDSKEKLIELVEEEIFQMTMFLDDSKNQLIKLLKD